MNRSALLHIVERLEGLLGKLPAAIQKPVLHELTPLKELFLQQRPPRLLLAGSGRWPMPQVVNLLFNGDAVEAIPRQMVFEIFRWQDLEIKDRGTVSVLDARGADDDAEKTIRGELERASADAIIILSDGSEGRTKVKKKRRKRQRMRPLERRDAQRRRDCRDSRGTDSGRRSQRRAG